MWTILLRNRRRVKNKHKAREIKGEWFGMMYLLGAIQSTVGVTHPVNFFLLLSFFDKMMLLYIGKWLVTIRGTRHDPII